MLSSSKRIVSGRRLWFRHACSRSASTMRAVHIYQYGDLQEVSVGENFKIPVLRRPDELLVRVHAAALNPLDVAMIGGYSAQILNVVRKLEVPESSEFPLILGRDLSGTVVAAGHEVPSTLGRPGTEVVAAKWPWESGCFADFVIVRAKQAARKPSLLSHEEAACLPYAAQTAYSALCNWGGLRASANNSNMRVLIHAANGGVGLSAMQLCRAWGVGSVSATCRRDEYTSSLTQLGAHEVFVLPRDRASLMLNSSFDLVLDCASSSGTEEADWLLQLVDCGILLRLKTPVGKAMSSDSGYLSSVVNTVTTLWRDTAQSTLRSCGQRQIRWAVVNLSNHVLTDICDMASKGTLHLPVQRLFDLSMCKDALQSLSSGPHLGKTVIKLV